MMAKSRLSMALADAKKTVRRLNEEISYHKDHADAIKRGDVALSKDWEGDSAFAREIESKAYLKINKYQSLIAQRTQAKKQIEKIERIKEMRRKRK